MMKKVSSFSSIPLSLFLTLVFSTFHCTTFSSATNLLEETCKKIAEKDPNISYTFCLTSLQPTNHNRTTDLRKLGLTSIGLVRHNITATRRHINTLLKQKSLDPFIKTRLNDCLDLYSNALPTLKEAKRNYKAKLYKDANFEINSVMDASSTCEDGFTEKEGGVSPLTRQNKNTFQLAAISLAIITMLQQISSKLVNYCL